MSANWNALQWDGQPGHYEVYYVSLTDRGSGCGAWIRYTMLAPQAGAATCSLWFMAMDPGAGAKGLFAIAQGALGGDQPAARADSELKVGDAVLTDRGMKGAFADVGWDLTWEPRLPAAEHVHPWLRGIASTLLFLPHPALDVAGTLTVGDRELVLDSAGVGQAHLWGVQDANRVKRHWATTSRRSRAPAGPTTSSTASPSTCRAWGARLGPARPSSDASAGGTSPPTARCG